MYIMWGLYKNYAGSAVIDMYNVGGIFLQDHMPIM